MMVATGTLEDLDQFIARVNDSLEDFPDGHPLHARFEDLLYKALVLKRDVLKRLVDDGTP